MQASSHGQLDPSEAPPGFIAVLKSDVATAALGNICRACDWRSACSGLKYRCMPYTVISCIDGRELKRIDGCSVVFKRRATNDETPNR
jgi:hypothetical protein